MKRRDTFKVLLVGGLAGGAITQEACKSDTENLPLEEVLVEKGYGRTPVEKAHDEKVKSEVFLNDTELGLIAVLCDIILPASETAGSASDAKVPEFIEFIVKDLPANQIPMRGGLMWLNGESNRRYEKQFVDCNEKEQLSIIDDIAYPDPTGKRPEMAPGIAFFKRLRNMTLTGYYTTKMGFEDLGYKGNTPNMWDGVPQEVLDKHGMSYPKAWMPKFVDHEKRNTQAEWDDEGNLLT